MKKIAFILIALFPAVVFAQNEDDLLKWSPKLFYANKTRDGDTLDYGEIDTVYVGLRRPVNGGPNYSNTPVFARIFFHCFGDSIRLENVALNFFDRRKKFSNNYVSLGKSKVMLGGLKRENGAAFILIPPQREPFVAVRLILKSAFKSRSKIYPYRIHVIGCYWP